MDSSQLPPDESRGILALVVHVVLTFMGLLVVGLRSAARRMTGDGFKADDYMMLLAMLITVVNLGFTIAGTTFGQGRHIIYLELEDAVEAVKTIFVGEFLLILSLAVVKLSVSLFLLRIGGLRKWLRWALITNTTVLLASTLAFIIVLWIQCRPLAANWDPRITDGVCYGPDVLETVTYVTTAFTILTDFLCALLPIPIIWDLKMSRRTKISIMGLMGLGVFAGACAITRMAYVPSLRTAREDPTWVVIPLGVWTVVELHVAIVVGSLPPCRTLILRIWGRLRGRSPSSESSWRSHPYGNSKTSGSEMGGPIVSKSWKAWRDNSQHELAGASNSLEGWDDASDRRVGPPPGLSNATEAEGGGIMKTASFTVTTTEREQKEQLGPDLGSNSR